MVDSTGILTERYQYTPYGQRTVYFSLDMTDALCYGLSSMSRRVTWTGSTTPQPYGLLEPGHQGLFHDEELGLDAIHNRARYLRGGRFMQRDPLGYVDGMSAYGGYHLTHGGLDPSGLDGTINGQAYVGEPRYDGINRITRYPKPGLWARVARQFGGGYIDVPGKPAANRLAQLQSARAFGLADAIGRDTPEAQELMKAWNQWQMRDRVLCWQALDKAAEAALNAPKNMIPRPDDFFTGHRLVYLARTAPGLTDAQRDELIFLGTTLVAMGIAELIDWGIPDPSDAAAAALRREAHHIMPNLEQRVAAAAKNGSVWNQDGRQRGTAIEAHLAVTEYKDWFHIGAEHNGKFPLVDFQQGQTLVSLKTVDTNGASWVGDMQSHIDDLATRGAKVSGQPANMVLDLRVQPGGAAAAQRLVEYARTEYPGRVTVVVKEYP